MDAHPLKTSAVPIEPEAEERRTRLFRVAFLLFGILCLAAFLYAAFDRSGAFRGNKAFLLVPIVLSIVFAFASPLAGALAVFLAIPCFGNFAGGRLMELLNIPLAAGVVGLVIRAWRRSLPPPRGRLWSAALLFVASAGIALIPSLEGVALRIAQINSLPEAVVETLTARETDPLYSLTSVILLALAAAWAYVLVWAAPGASFARWALRCAAVAFLLVVVLGALNLHGLIDLAAILRRIDSRSLSLEGFQSIFWNPSWFAFYFVMAFGLVLGLLWVESLPVRWFLGAVLAVSYFYSFASPQRGGLLALHAALIAALAYLLAASRLKKRNLLGALAILLLSAALAVVAFKLVPKPEWRGSALARLTSGTETDAVRKNLTMVAVRMWRDFPLFGIGEGAFAWRYGEYVRVGAHPSTDAASGDAHNNWLHILATRGLLGFALYLCLLIALARRVVAAARQRGPERGIGLGIAFSLIAFFTYSFVQHLFYLQAIQVFFWGIVALAAIVAPGERQARPASRSTRWMIAAAAVATLALQLGWSWPRLKKGAARIALEPRGFSGVEIWDGVPMRWSSREGTLCLYPTAPVATLRILSADPDLATRPITVSIEAEGRLLDRFELRSAATHVSSFYLFHAEQTRRGGEAIPFGQCVAEAQPLRVSFETSRTWSPFSRGVSGDTRHLGVAVFEPSFARALPGLELGLYPPETDGGIPIRWTGPRASIGVTIPGEKATITLPIRAMNPDLERRPLRVEAFWNSDSVGAALLARNDWRELQFAVRDPRRWGILTLQVARVWRPDASELGADPRSVGVQMGVPRVEAATPAGSSRAPTDHS